MKNRSVNLRDAFAIRERWNLTIEKNKEKIRAEVGEAAAAGNEEMLKKTKRVGHKMNFPELDEGVFKFVEMARQKRFPNRPAFVLNVATFLALKLGFETFKASQGWYRGFYSRHGIDFKKLHGNFEFRLT